MQKETINNLAKSVSLQDCKDGVDIYSSATKAGYRHYNALGILFWYARQLGFYQGRNNRTELTPSEQEGGNQ